MSPENTHKLMGFYMEGLILGVNTMYMFFCFSKLFLIGCIGLTLRLRVFTYAVTFGKIDFFPELQNLTLAHILDYF